MKKRFGLAVGSVFLALCLMSGCGAAPKASMDGAWAPAGGDSLPWISEGENYQYDSVIEQGFYDVATQPSSYFSLDRNTAGYSLVRAQIRRGSSVSPDSVRLEELVNYFDYDYPAPEGEESIRVSAYLSDCPWNVEHKLMTLGIRTEEAAAEGDANYVLLVDVSGSMSGFVSGTEESDEPSRSRPLRRRKARRRSRREGQGLHRDLRERVKTVLESTAATEEGKKEIRNALSRLTANGSTSGSAGLELAYEQAEAHRAETATTA